MFSVVMPLYNKGLSVGSAIQSVLNQTYKDFELIVVNDGSTDASADIVASFEDPRCRLIHKVNGGVSSARNAGIRASSNEFIAFIDADDLWSPMHLEVLNRLIKRFGDHADVFSTMIVETEAELNCGLYVAGILVEDSLIVDYFVPASAPARLLSSSSFAVRQSVAHQVGLFDERLSYGEDVEFWYRIFRRGFKLAATPQATAQYRLEAENRSSGRVIPIERRFHRFDFRGATISERKYLGKLLLLVLADYARQGEFRVVLRMVQTYVRSLHWALRYGWLLLVKKGRSCWPWRARSGNTRIH